MVPDTVFIDVDVDRIPTVTAEQMREVDRATVEDIGVSLVQMMENAGRLLADSPSPGSRRGR